MIAFRLIRISKWILIVIGLITLAIIIKSCKDDDLPCNGYLHDLPERNHDKVTIQQGIWGDIWFWEGDFMPVCMTGTITPIVREVLIHELTHTDDVVRTSNPYGAFYDEINTNLISTVWSDNDGYFEVDLPVGHYSLFVVEDTMFYSNSSDGQGNLSPVEVKDNEVAEIRFDITYKTLW